MDLTAYTLSQLFTRQAMLHAQHASALLARNQYPAISPDWDLWDSLAVSLMEDLADAAGEVTRRCAQMQAETAAARTAARTAAGPGSHGGRTADGSRYCRTCGATDCPGAGTGECPRWPARTPGTCDA